MDIENEIFTSTNEVTLRFYSNDIISGRSFAANYSQTCGGTFYERSGEIKTKKYPEPYAPLDYDCVWKIQLEPGYKVKVKFYPPVAIDGGGEDCSENGGGYLTMYNGDATDEVKICPKFDKSGP